MHGGIAPAHVTRSDEVYGVRGRHGHMHAMTPNFIATRHAGLAALAACTPTLGHAYASGRNTEAASGAPPTTSQLSPYLRHRLVLEQEAVAAALDGHGGAAAEKFVQEVFWRSYFKGHLETRPWLWTDYLAQLGAAQAKLAANPGLRLAYAQAAEGRTGIDGFDDWARALGTENWLHNHARMWFASIWIFTLRLPWVLGADLFMRHLLDGDPASNTLSWRWVAGLHTRGKPYAARAENIRRYTEGRYAPSGLNETPEPLDEPQGPPAVPPPRPVAVPAGEAALLLHLEDLHPESLDLGPARVVRVVPVLAHAPDAAAAVRRADEAAMADAVSRATARFGCPAAPDEGGLPAVTAYAPVGPSAAALPPCATILRPWDAATWPRSTAGFFKVKTAIPTILKGLR